MRPLIQAIQELSGARTMEGVAAIVRVAARCLAGADGATFVLKEGSDCYYLDEDAISPLWKGRRFPAAACISGWAMEHRQVAVIPDIYVDPRIPHDAYRPTFVRSLAMVPVRSRDPIAAIGVYWAASRVADPSDIEMLQLLADSTATAMENVHLHNTMQRQVEERTRELRLAREQAEQASAVKSRFLAAASHNLRQPIQTLSTVVAILQRVSADEAPAHVRSMGDAVRNMESMLDTLLDLHRLDQGAIEPKPQDALLDGVFARLRSEFAYPASAKGLSLDIPQTAPAVHSDAHLLQEILRNFLSNAIKYTVRGGVRLECLEAGDALRIEVSDTGPGIPPAHLERIFEAFYRAPDAVASANHGLGLGLSIVDQLARILRHPIGARSTPSEGSRFWITVPRARSGVALQPERATSAQAASAPGGGGRILYIEDHPGVRQSITALLQIEGYEVIAASDGAEALKAIVERGVDPAIVISDFQLPAGETGEQVVQRIRAELDRAVPALLLTGRARDSSRSQNASLAHKVLYKPVDANELLEEVAVLMRLATAAEKKSA